MAIEVIRSNKAFTNVVQWHYGENVFDNLNVKGDTAKVKGEIRNGEEIEVQVQFPFIEEAK